MPSWVLWLSGPKPKLFFYSSFLSVNQRSLKAHVEVPIMPGGNTRGMAIRDQEPGTHDTNKPREIITRLSETQRQKRRNSRVDKFLQLDSLIKKQVAAHRRTRREKQHLAGCDTFLSYRRLRFVSEELLGKNNNYSSLCASRDDEKFLY